jgi:hypothetical protein
VHAHGLHRAAPGATLGWPAVEGSGNARTRTRTARSFERTGVAFVGGLSTRVSEFSVTALLRGLRVGLEGLDFARFLC